MWGDGAHTCLPSETRPNYIVNLLIYSQICKHLIVIDLGTVCLPTNFICLDPFAVAVTSSSPSSSLRRQHYILNAMGADRAALKARVELRASGVGVPYLIGCYLI